MRVTIFGSISDSHLLNQFPCAVIVKIIAVIAYRSTVDRPLSYSIWYHRISCDFTIPQGISVIYKEKPCVCVNVLNYSIYPAISVYNPARCIRSRCGIRKACTAESQVIAILMYTESTFNKSCSCSYCAVRTLL